ncbi:MAG TPA: aminotransferase class IV, partial [Stellaceae bacterium]|nr:aminotransferase class IV [Stellaceae bacterium]
MATAVQPAYDLRALIKHTGAKERIDLRRRHVKEKTEMIGEIVYVNGEFVPKDEAKISVFDHNFIYGDGIFEGLQAVSGGVFKLRQHIERLYQSARFLAIEIPMSMDKFMG